MFTQKCFIRENSKELWNYLHRNIGGRKGDFLCDISTMLLCASNKYYRNYDDEWNNADNLIKKGYIDCGKDEELFLAVAALRDDTDKYQLFFQNNDVDCKYQLECIHDEFHFISIDMETLKGTDHKDKWHKGTVEELIKHFKNKQNYV